jgi:protoheme IX farnesyltransferase
MVAAIVCAAALHVWRRARGHRALRALALAAPVLVAVQIAFGVLSVYTWLSLWAVTVHLANGALLLGVTLSLYLVSRSPAAQPATTATLAVPLLRDLLDLTKPRITLMNLITSAGGLWLAPGELSPALAFWTLFGTALVVAGAGTLNCYLERDIDKLMERTRNRPLPAGRLQPRTALGMGLALCAAGLPILSFLVNPLTGLLAAVALVFYVCIYTPMKQASSFALMVGAVPGAMPPLMGWAAATGTMRGPGLVLFAILFLWQLPHFLALALYRKDDYRAAGLHVTPLDLGDARTRVEIVQYLLALVPVSLLLVVMRVAGVAYLAAALLLGGIFIGYGLAGLRARDERAHLRWARGLFRYSLVYLTLLFAVLVASAGT